jgi:hypothetical protein
MSGKNQNLACKCEKCETPGAWERRHEIGDSQVWDFAWIKDPMAEAAVEFFFKNSNRVAGDPGREATGGRGRRGGRLCLKAGRFEF